MNEKQFFCHNMYFFGIMPSEMFSEEIPLNKAHLCR